MPQMDKIAYYSQILWNLLGSISFYTLIIMVLFVSYCIIFFKYIFNLIKNNQLINFLDSLESLNNNRVLNNLYIK